MVFMDRTNLFERLKAERIVVASLYNLLVYYSDQRKIVRMYLYTIEQHRQAAKARHGEIFSTTFASYSGPGSQRGTATSRKKASMRCWSPILFITQQQKISITRS